MSIIPGTHLKQQMHDGALANGTSASVVDMNCTNNTSSSIVDSGISSAANRIGGSSNSATGPTLTSAGSNSPMSASHNQNVPISASSGTPFDNTVDATRSSDTPTGVVESNSSVSIDQQST